MGGNVICGKWASVVIVLLFTVIVTCRGELTYLVTGAEPLDKGTRGSSEMTWTQTTQMDFENGTSVNMITTQNGEMRLGLESKSVKDDFTDESRIGHKENVVVDTSAGEVRLSRTDTLLINKTFGWSREDYGNSVQQTPDGGYVVSGSTNSTGSGGLNAWLIKTDSSGNEQWNRTFGGSGKDYGHLVQYTSDNGYMIAGCTQSYGAGNLDAWLIKTDSSGNEQWNRTFGGSGSDCGFSGQQTSDSRYVVVGYTESFGSGNRDAWLIKTDNLGNEQWNRTFDLGESDTADSVQQTSDGGYVIVGTVYNYSGRLVNDILLVKTDSSGIEQWNRTFGGNESDYGLAVQQTSDGGYIVAGSTESYDAGIRDIWLIKTDGSGYEQWNRTFGGKERDDGHAVQQNPDGGYVVAGETQSYGAGEMDVWVIKTDNLGNEQWNKTFGGGQWDVASYHWFGLSIQQTSDDAYIVVGSTQSFGAGDWDVWLIKTKASVDYRGNLVSLNLLSGQSAHLVESFHCTATISTGSRMRVQFSQDGQNWYNVSGDLDQWDALFNGFNSIDLSELGWKGSGLYYKIEMASNSASLPALLDVNVSYSQHIPSGFFESEPFNSGTHPTWRTLNWSGITPQGTEIRIQLRTSDTDDGLKNAIFVGPNGSSAAYYASSGQTVCICHEEDRRIQYKVYLFTADTSTTPVLDEVTITYEFVDSGNGGIPGPDGAGTLANLYLAVLIVAVVIIISLSTVVIKARQETREAETRELPPDKLLVLLEKKHAAGKMTNKTYEDIKSQLEK